LADIYNIAFIILKIYIYNGPAEAGKIKEGKTLDIWKQDMKSRNPQPLILTKC